jgi:CDP-diacylglycerol--glycerol-3-phosphate 3-phosphatidyltransferase
MANAITVGRLLLLFVVIWLIYAGDVQVVGACMLLIAIVFASDGIDGYVARRRGSTSDFGAVFDIAGDRVVENALWVVFADLDLIPVWVPLLVLTRGFLVDGLRALSISEGMTPFGEKNMMRTAFTRWLTAGRFMRGLYGYAKALGFIFLTGLAASEKDDAPGTWIESLYDVDLYRFAGWACVWLAVALTIVRGLPVVFDAYATYQERSNTGSSSRGVSAVGSVPSSDHRGAVR